MDYITDFIDDVFFSSSRFIRRNKIKSDSKRIIISENAYLSFEISW